MRDSSEEQRSFRMRGFRLSWRIMNLRAACRRAHVIVVLISLFLSCSCVANMMICFEVDILKVGRSFRIYRSNVAHCHDCRCHPNSYFSIEITRTLILLRQKSGQTHPEQSGPQNQRTSAWGRPPCEPKHSPRKSRRAATSSP